MWSMVQSQTCRHTSGSGLYPLSNAASNGLTQRAFGTGPVLIRLSNTVTKQLALQPGRATKLVSAEEILEWPVQLLYPLQASR